MLFFPSEQFRQILDYITRTHRLVLSSFVIDELVYTPHNMKGNLFEIRDRNDYPVLYTAIIENVDIFITGDKDFLDVDIEIPKIMTPADFIEKFIRDRAK